MTFFSGVEARMFFNNEIDVLGVKELSSAGKLLEPHIVTKPVLINACAIPIGDGHPTSAQNTRRFASNE